MTTDPNPHLLFGLLALQNGLVDQAQLVAAFHAWTCDRSRPLADHLESLGHLNGSQRGALEALAALYVEKHDGDVEKSLAALHIGASTRESLAQVGGPEVEATLRRIGPRPTEGEEDDRTATLSLSTTTSDGQRFRVLRPHAHGGLGAVYVALDAELNREVALKEILGQHAHDPVSRARFLREAEVTGGLEHPGIVPVYGMGCYADGWPYYAMRFIKGDSLKQAIASFHADARLKRDPGLRSLELRKLLRRFLDVCNAIEYAHRRGVLHRDLKPGNIMVGRYGETLVVDWGLARTQEKVVHGSAEEERTLVPSPASGSSETLPGAAMGTPAYMSPEQAAGDLKRLGPHSDVYSLGATLYCLLTGKPPFEGSDVGAVLWAVHEGKFPRPREIDPTIDRALEAVCLKAMALKPEDRYDSPRALADDVERWSADEPVTSYPEGLRARLGRWGRRHRAWVQAGAASLALLMVTAVLFAVERGRSADRLLGEQKKTAAALTAETEQRKEAEAQTELTNRRLYIINMNSVQRSWEDYNGALFRQLLDDQRPEHQGRGVDRRNFEWFYWERKFSSGYRTLKGHAGLVACVAFSPDGKRLASAGYDQTVRVWDAATGQEALTLKEHAGGVICVAFSPDGTRLASAGMDRTVKVWDGRPLDDPVERGAINP